MHSETKKTSLTPVKTKRCTSVQPSAIQSCKRINVELCWQYEERTLNDKIRQVLSMRFRIKLHQPPRDVWQSRRCRNPAPLSGSLGHAKLISSLQPGNRAAPVGPASNNFTCVTSLKHWPLTYLGCSPRDACTRRDQDIPVCQNSPSSAGIYIPPTLHHSLLCTTRSTQEKNIA